MNFQRICKLQHRSGLTQLQNWINTGLAWQLKGHVGRTAMRALEDGACMLPIQQHRDYWGNLIPVRTDVKPGTTGSYQNSAKFWSDPRNQERMGDD